MSGQITPAVAALAEKIFTEAVAVEIAGTEINQSHEDIAERAFKAAIAFGETGRRLANKRL
ncbi:hypothetical protein [Stenotrophomonas maltophilia]|uniref:hypothetical protein n=1 Tax=Stenotrophomonas maltophilia TaxID=40324 RepID=UPI0038770D10